MSQFNTDGLEKTACPGCGQTFINGNDLNKHKRTCPEIGDSSSGPSLEEFMEGR